MKKAISLILALALCASLAVPAWAVDTTGLTSATAKEYYNALASYHAPLYADLKDLNGDGTVELIVADIEDHAEEGNIVIWQIKGGKAVKTTSGEALAGLTMYVGYLKINGKTYVVTCAYNSAHGRTLMQSYGFLSTDGVSDYFSSSLSYNDDGSEEVDYYINSQKTTETGFVRAASVYGMKKGGTDSPELYFTSLDTFFLDCGGKTWVANDEATTNYQATLNVLTAKMSEANAPAAGTYGTYTLNFTHSGGVGTITFDSAKLEKVNYVCDYVVADSGYTELEKTESEDFNIVTIRPDCHIVIANGLEFNNHKNLIGWEEVYLNNGKLTMYEEVGGFYEPANAEELYNRVFSDSPWIQLLNTTPTRTLLIADGRTYFSDVPAIAYYAEPVQWAVGKGITNGTSANTFSPDATCTTAQILTFLHRAKGSPASKGGNPYTDVKSGDYFYNAAIWAHENGLVSGNRFNGSAPCTRAAVVTYLWKLAGKPSARVAAFSDVPASAEYAQAVAWAVAQGITNGTGDTTFSPDATCTRGQIVTFLYRAYGK